MYKHSAPQNTVTLAPLPEELCPLLLAWYSRNARVLPWRENTDPYRVWVSEIMLQQTRVEAVIPYYQRFLRTLPTLRDLAECEEPLLLKLWEGLGYYTRVRNLQKAALTICEKYGGVFPDDFEAIRSLPGIGDYTAGAISSIAFGKPTPAVDGNVLRVLSRVTEDERDIADASVKKEYTERLRRIYPKEGCGDFTQSLMELGAIVCLPNGEPQCARCPLQKICRAHLSARETELPVKAAKKERRVEKMTVFLLKDGEYIALQRRPDSGLLAGMWQFPNASGFLNENEAKQFLTGQGITVKTLTRAPEYRHIFTHIEWKMRVCLTECEGMGEYTAVTLRQLREEIALPAAFGQLLELFGQ